MKSFFPVRTKFTAHGMQWSAQEQRTINPNTAITQRIQVWRSKKTWLTITCRYDLARETLIWEVSKFNTANTRSGAAALAASQTREALDAYVDRLALYGDKIERHYATTILKKKGHVNIEEHSRAKEKQNG